MLITGVTPIGEYETEEEFQKLRKGLPEPGAVTICAECGSLWSYDSRLKLVAASDEYVRAGVPESLWLAITKARELVKIRDEELVMCALGLKAPTGEHGESAWQRAARRKRGQE